MTRVAFKLDASYSFIVASCVIDLGKEVEAFRETRCGGSSLGCRVRVDRIGKDCELEISKILFGWTPGIGVSQFGIIACMCTETSSRVGRGCTAWSFTTLGESGLSLSLGLHPMKTHSSNQETKRN